MACNDPLSLTLDIGTVYVLDAIVPGNKFGLLTGAISRETIGGERKNHNPWTAEFLFDFELSRMPNDDCVLDDTFLDELLAACTATVTYMGTDYDGVVTSPNIDIINRRDFRGLRIVFTGFEV